MIDDLLRRLRTSRSFVRSRRAERALLVVAAIAFVASAVVGWISLPDIEEVRWWLLVLTAAGAVPLTVFTNALEFQVTARLAGRHIAYPRAVRIAVLSSAANLLPVPGAVMVRVQAIRQRGTSYGQAVSATAVVGVGWLATTFTLVGGFHMVLGERGPVAGAVLALGIAGLTGTHLLVRRAQAAAGTSWRIVAIETTAVSTNALRYFLVLAALDADPTVTQAVTLAMSSVLASVVGIFPGGLGIRELLAAGLGPLVGLSAAVSLVAAAVDRVLGLIVLGLATAVLLATGRGVQPEPALDPSGEADSVV